MRAGILVLLTAAAGWAQEGTLDVLDGETLYEEGWLFTLGYDLILKEGLRHGASHESDPLDRRQLEHTQSIAVHYGLRNNIQLSILLPYVRKELEVDDPAGPDSFSAEGVGDIPLIVKWRFYRWDAPHQTLNVAVISGVELPTGSTDERDHGARLDPDLQPGSGSWDPFLGFAATFEPKRWRFSSFIMYKRNSEGHHDFKHGDQLFGEIAIGNRFWLEPYPGPFMRLDFVVRYRREWKDRDEGDAVDNSGGTLWTVGLNYAFRPQPIYDLQLAVEFPFHETLHGTQIGQDYSVFLALGYRI